MLRTMWFGNSRNIFALDVCTWRLYFKMWYLWHNGYRCYLPSETVWVRALKDMFFACWSLSELFLRLFLNGLLSQMVLHVIFMPLRGVCIALKCFHILKEVTCHWVFIQYQCFVFFVWSYSVLPNLIFFGHPVLPYRDLYTCISVCVLFFCDVPLY